MIISSVGPQRGLCRGLVTELYECPPTALSDVVGKFSELLVRVENFVHGFLSSLNSFFRRIRTCQYFFHQRPHYV